MMLHTLPPTTFDPFPSGSVKGGHWCVLNMETSTAATLPIITHHEVAPLLFLPLFAPPACL